MKILDKYKKHFDLGFKDFVLKLDLLPPKIVKEMVSNGILEDPVYLQWAMENKHHFDYFIKLDKEDVLKVYRALSNPGILFLRALKGHAEESNFITANLPGFILKQYINDREIEKVTIAHQEDARAKIMQAIFNLKDNGDLSTFDWKLPPADVMTGKSQNVDKFGLLKQYYSNGVLAITGSIEKGKRSGVWKNYYNNGALYAEGVYKNGQKENEWRFYYLNGKLKEKGLYKEDLKTGEWIEYGITEDDETIITYMNGKAIKD